MSFKDDYEKAWIKAEKAQARLFVDMVFKRDTMNDGIDWKALVKATSDPHWRGGGSVCSHTSESCPTHPSSPYSCNLCGTPKSWHSGGENSGRKAKKNDPRR